ncbi:MAG: threonylcarbamoyl-AMP synthase [Planctomycetaceae bacterium]|nr:threonylcarbamoyl-AMP synthase [Planctomycetaceae bacterium]|tara:strand:+ start:207 stop:1334 length:1128 start_codon:yes stop_codon:yes gene_type:complete
MNPVVIDTRATQDPRDVVHRAVEALAGGRLVAFPTETVYGLAASALDEGAVDRLIDAKGRGQGHPFTLAVRSAEEALDYAPDLSPMGRRLSRRCWPGPITLVAENNHPESLLAQLPTKVKQAVVPNGTVGLRVPAHPLILDVLRMLTGPVALTSANQTGEPEAITAEEVVSAFGDQIDLVLDGGKSRLGQPSSVVRVHETSYDILRAGVVTEQHLKRLSSVMILIICTGNTCRSPMGEVIGRNLLAKKIGCNDNEVDEHGVVITSAGIAAMAGGQASPQGIEVMKKIDLDLTSHSAQPVSEQMVRHADLILTMTRGHREALLSQWPEAASRTEVLRLDGKDVADPIGESVAEYQRCAEQIRKELETRIEKITLNN